MARCRAPAHRAHVALGVLARAGKREAGVPAGGGARRARCARGRDAPVDVRARRRALGRRGREGGALPLAASREAFRNSSIRAGARARLALGPRVPIGTKVQSGKRSKKMRAPAGARRAAARAPPWNATSGGGGAVSPFSAYDAGDVDRAATRRPRLWSSSCGAGRPGEKRAMKTGGRPRVRRAWARDPAGPVFLSARRGRG